MARPNVAISPTPGPSSATAYQSQTPTTTRHSIQPGSFSPTASSDKENQASPVPRSRDKGKGRMPPPGKLPTPNSDPASISRNGKRRRVDDRDSTPSALQGDYEEAEDEQRPKSERWYNPGQPETERREVKRKSRALERAFLENRDEYLKNDNAGLQQTIVEANSIFEGVKQTSDAVLDSRLMVSVSDLTHKKSAQLVLGDTSTGIDVDDFVSKCIFFMRQPPATRNDRSDAPRATQQRRRRRSSRDDDADDDETNEAMLDWEALGTRACFPHNLRPPVPGFLLGPLSVEKRVRAPTQRRARQAKDAGGQEVRPEALTKEDLETNENNTVRTICGNIMRTLTQHCKSAMDAVEEVADENWTEEQVAQEMRNQRITDTGGPSLFDFVVNPHSFGQTVENLFYISFLIKEGEVGVQMDSEGLPTLCAGTESMHAARERHATKHQAVFGLDYPTWQQLVDAFQIETPLIPHRATEQSTQVGARGWYG